jgi:hypothetical protein
VSNVDNANVGDTGSDATGALVFGTDAQAAADIAHIVRALFRKVLNVAICICRKVLTARL